MIFFLGRFKPDLANGHDHTDNKFFLRNKYANEI